jgi:vesicle coat complex subunit
MLMKGQIRSMLSGGDRRSLGRVAEVIDLVRRYPKLIPSAVECLRDGDTRVCMRAADALEKLSREQAVFLQSYTTHLLGLLAETTQQEVRWHLAVILPRLRLTNAEAHRVAKILQFHLQDQSSIVKTSAMQGLADLTNQYGSLRPDVLDLIRALTRTGTPAMRARGRKLLKKLESENA